MPAGRGNSCEPCYWRNAFFKRLAIDEAGFSTSEFVSLFREFGLWLLARGPAQKAALKLHGYFVFFFEMERRCEGIPAYKDLLERFNKVELRKFRIPILWLSETAVISMNEEVREEILEQRRIDVILARIVSDSPAAVTMNDYYKVLSDRLANGKTTLRSVRLALRPAASLTLICVKNGDEAVNQTAIDRYLFQSPGQRAAAAGFVAFLNRIFATTLVCCVDKKRMQVSQKKALEETIIALIAEKSRDKIFLMKWLVAGLSYFHGIASAASKGVRTDMVSFDDTGWISIVWQENTYVVPHWNNSSPNSLDRTFARSNVQKST